VISTSLPAGRLLWAALLACVASVVCIAWVDQPLSHWIARTLLHFAVYDRATHVPDQLLAIVGLISGASWMAYFRWRGDALHHQQAQFVQTLGIALPAAFVLKDGLKWVFGRTETHAWLAGMPDAFHWFAGGAGQVGFPSGHMLVLSPLFLACWQFIPRYRLLCAALWGGLGVALMVTEYHFLSDVLAGTGIGVLVHQLTRRLLAGTTGGVADGTERTADNTA
jgi:membrane-associated phospholipid phosphatase